MNGDTIQIDVPKRELVAAFLEKVARLDRAGDIPLTDMQARAALLPSVGAEMEGGIYAGLTIHIGMPHALVLLPGDEELPWAKAVEWAAKQGGAQSSSLPSRIDGLVLFQNLKREFKEEYYWTSETHAGNADYAWIQDFDDGYQGYYRKSSSAVAEPSAE